MINFKILNVRDIIFECGHDECEIVICDEGFDNYLLRNGKVVSADCFGTTVSANLAYFKSLRHAKKVLNKYNRGEKKKNPSTCLTLTQNELEFLRDKIDEALATFSDKSGMWGHSMS